MLAVVFLLAGLLSAETQYFRCMERLDRGMIAVSVGDNGVFISWRRFGTDPGDIGFNVYRNSIKINASLITGATNYTDAAGNAGDSYSVRPVAGGIEQDASSPVSVWSQMFLEVPLQVPSGVTTPDGVTCSYSPNDCSVGDLDGDGQYEIVVKWDPSNAKDNSHSGYTGNVYLDAYELDGTLLCRIDLGINIRAGAHYTQLIVYDLDSDGKAEVACRTAPYSRDGQGSYILLAGDTLTDYRNSGGYIITGPEYLTIFDGQTGMALVTTNFNPDRGSASQWGDGYGNRCDRFLAGVAYLDGQRPSLIMARGYYAPQSGYSARNEITAWDWRDGELTQLWWFKAHTSGPNANYIGQGNHNLSIGDVDGDGFDEIVYGACAIDHNGTGLHSTGFGHGDAMHMSDLNPTRPGLESYNIHEGSGTPGSSFRDAWTGEILWQTGNTDVGRGAAADIDPRYPGYECWGTGGVRSCDGSLITGTNPPSTNHVIWWDGDLTRELLDGEKIDKWLPEANDGSGGSTRLLTAYNYGAENINGSKNNPCLQADILGDWREEVIWRHYDNARLLIFTTTAPTSYPIYTLMHDPQYRLAVVWQNVAYNQPPHPGFFLGSGMSTPPVPQIQYAGVDGGLLREWWTGIEGSSVSDLTANGSYPDNPSGSSVLRHLQGPSNWADAAGTRLRGWLIPPADGIYTFWVSADDSAQLWLSSDATSANASLIASVPAWTGPLQWDKYASQQSASLVLEAGHKYYTELLHKDSSGDDHFAVAWQGPGLARQVITGDYLRPWASHLAGDVTGNRLFDLQDLSMISTQWQQSDCGFALSLDVNGDCEVNVSDLILAAENWLYLTEKTIQIQENEPGFVHVEGTVDSDNAGFTGDGFANTFNTQGAYIEWRIHSPRAGSFDLRWRYANGTTTDRSGTVTVNGTVEASGISFGGTGAWTTWMLSPTATVGLQEGSNLIRLVAEVSGQGLANIDWMDVTGLSPEGVNN